MIENLFQISLVTEPLLLATLIIIIICLCIFRKRKHRFPTHDEFLEFAFESITLIGGLILSFYLITGQLFTETVKEEIKWNLFVTGLAIIYRGFLKLKSILNYN
jgi:uncharacterized protein YybS (DUF2232 family)